VIVGVRRLVEVRRLVKVDGLVGDWRWGWERGAYEFVGGGF